jgi:hypothetical protein
MEGKSMSLTFSNITDPITTAGANFETALNSVTAQTAGSTFDIGAATAATVNVQVNQDILEIASGAGKVLTDAMKGTARKLG